MADAVPEPVTGSRGHGGKGRVPASPVTWRGAGGGAGCVSCGQTVARRLDIELKGNEGVSRADMGRASQAQQQVQRPRARPGSRVGMGRSSGERDGAGSAGSERPAGPGSTQPCSDGRGRQGVSGGCDVRLSRAAPSSWTRGQGHTAQHGVSGGQRGSGCGDRTSAITLSHGERREVLSGGFRKVRFQMNLNRGSALGAQGLGASSPSRRLWV